MRAAVLVDAVRTPSGRGKPGGAWADTHPARLLASTLRELVLRADFDPALLDDVIAGVVTQSGEQSFNVGRTALLAAGFPETVPGTTVDRQCGSSQQATHFAVQGVLSGNYDAVIACGVESMSRVPMGSATQGHDPFAALQERYPDGLVHQGIAAELLAARWEMERAELDDFAARSHERALAATKSGRFDGEIVAADLLAGGIDETIRETSADVLSRLSPVFVDETVGRRFPEISWVITAGNSSPITDGASAALIVEEDVARRLGLKARARFHTLTVAAAEPLLMLNAIVPATEKALRRSGLKVADLDVVEVNEAFAPVPLLWEREFRPTRDVVNPNGGAIALGHPLGASGTRILATLVNELERIGGRYGLQTVCEGGGMANTTIIERI